MNYKPIANEQLEELEANPLAIRFLKSYRQLLKEYGVLQSELSEVKDENQNLRNKVTHLTNRDKPFDRLESRIELLESENEKLRINKKELGLISVENNSLKQMVVKNEKLKANNHFLNTINDLLRNILMLKTNSRDLVLEVDSLINQGNIEEIESYSKYIKIELKEKGFFTKQG